MLIYYIIYYYCAAGAAADMQTCRHQSDTDTETNLREYRQKTKH